MAVTRSWTGAGTAPVMIRVERRAARLQVVWLLLSSLLVATLSSLCAATLPLLAAVEASWSL